MKQESPKKSAGKRSAKNITYFRVPRNGPERLIERSVTDYLRHLGKKEDGRNAWLAHSLPIGAGMPDIVLVKYRSELARLPKPDDASIRILAYLRSVNSATPETISSRTNVKPRMVLTSLSELESLKAVTRRKTCYAVRKKWRGILYEIVTVEAKVTKWRDGVAQAARNTVFAHRNFVALPSRLAHRVKRAPEFRKFGIGLLSVDDDGSVRLLRRSRRREPRIWTYYYRLASAAANSA